jgi:hypothetical protein
MGGLVANPIPELYVLWHPHCPLGEFLAKRVYAWLRPGNGLGPQVLYRSLPAPEAPRRGLPPPLPGEHRGGTASPRAASRTTNLQIVLILVDANMVADGAWRHWLLQIGSQSSLPRACLPVALDSTAYNLAGPLRERNFLRPAGLPPSGNGPLTSAGRELVARSLLKQLTEALCGLLLNSSSAAPRGLSSWDAVSSKIKVFLSHAKSDGSVPAKKVRDYIYSQTQLTAFFDENDIPIASEFSSVISNVLQSADTAALIAVRSARYASRPWCRRELSLFRRPIRESSDQGPTEHWRLSPTLVVDALEVGSYSVGIPELGNAPLIRWTNGVADQEELIVTTVMRDVLLASFHSAVGRTIPHERDRIVLNWIPDPTTLLQIPRIQANERVKVVYPGRGLSGLELDILWDQFGERVELHSFEEILS